MSKEKNIWTDCKKLLVVFPFKNETNFKEYRLALDKLLNESNVNELKIVVSVPDSVKKEELQQHKLIQYISSKDFSFFGKLKDLDLETTLVQPYDLLLWLEVENDKLKNIFLKVNANTKIGVNASADLFTIQVNTNSQNPIEIVNFAKNTLEKISRYE